MFNKIKIKDNLSLFIPEHVHTVFAVSNTKRSVFCWFKDLKHESNGANRHSALAFLKYLVH